MEAPWMLKNLLQGCSESFTQNVWKNHLSNPEGVWHRKKEAATNLNFLSAPCVLGSSHQIYLDKKKKKKSIWIKISWQMFENCLAWQTQCHKGYGARVPTALVLRYKDPKVTTTVFTASLCQRDALLVPQVRNAAVSVAWKHSTTRLWAARGERHSSKEPPTRSRPPTSSLEALGRTEQGKPAWDQRQTSWNGNIFTFSNWHWNYYH